MAGYNVTVAQKDKYTIVNSTSQVFEGTIKDAFFVREDGRKAEIIGVLKEEFKRQFFRDDKGNDYAYEEGPSGDIVLPVLDAIEQRNIYELKAQDYIVLSDWKKEYEKKNKNQG